MINLMYNIETKKLNISIFDIIAIYFVKILKLIEKNLLITN